MTGLLRAIALVESPRQAYSPPTRYAPTYAYRPTLSPRSDRASSPRAACVHSRIPVLFVLSLLLALLLPASLDRLLAQHFTRRHEPVPNIISLFSQVPPYLHHHHQSTMEQQLQ